MTRFGAIYSNARSLMNFERNLGFFTKTYRYIVQVSSCPAAICDMRSGFSVECGCQGCLLGSLSRIERSPRTAENAT